ncbi:hypothetical protein ACFC06_13210 [Nocardia sp. NPDC056064]|uniref:hypothetical protein n=1 Tax=Nocardia sp. NPDC056064 TaxID=3345701 RepID=UPI0035E3B284
MILRYLHFLVVGTTGAVALTGCQGVDSVPIREFTAAPTSCTAAIAAAHQEIAEFAGELYVDDLSFKDSGELEGPSSTRRCFGSYASSVGSWEVPEADLNRPQRRTVNVYFTADVGNYELPDGRVAAAERVFDRNKPSNATDCVASIGDDCYVVTRLEEGSCMVKLSFRVGNLISQVQVATMPFDALSVPRGYEGTSISGAEKVAAALARQLDAFVPHE